MVADFADHDDVGVLAQDGAQGLGKVQIDLGVDLGLAHTGQLVFDRVFHRHDVAVRRVQPLQRRIQRGGFARTGGAGHQHNAVRLGNQVFKALQGGALHANRLQRQARAAFVEQAQHGALAMGAGQGGDTHIDGALAQAQRDAPVLGQAFFGDVEQGHDLQARDQRGVQSAVGLHHLAQAAIDAKAHAGVALKGFNVDVAGAVARGLRQQSVEHADDGRVVGRFEQVFDGGQGLHHARQIGLALDLGDHRGGAGAGTRIGRADALGQALCVQVLPLAHWVQAQHLAPGARVGLVAVPQRQLLAVVFQQQLVAAGKGIGQGVAHGY